MCQINRRGCAVASVFLGLLLCVARADSAPTEIYFWPVGESDIFLADLVQEFERRNPDVRVIRSQTASFDRTSDPTRLLCSIAGGFPPDVVEFDRYAVGEWAARGAFMSLQPLLEAQDPTAPDAILAENYYAPAWDESVYEGQLFAVPSSFDTRPLFYNKDLLIRAGLVDERGDALPPRTWDDLRRYNRILTQYQTPGDPQSPLTRIGYLPISSAGFSNCYLYMYGFMNGGEFMSPDGRTCTLDDPRIIEALDYVTTLCDDLGGVRKVQSFVSGLQGGFMDPFLTGQLAMRIDVGALLGVIAAFKPEMNFGVAPPPVPEGRPPVSWSGGWSWVIPAGARHPDAAWRLIRWLASAEAELLRAQAQYESQRAAGQMYIPTFSANERTNNLLVRRFVFDDPSIPQRYKEALRVVLDLMPVSRYRPVTPAGQLLWNEHLRATEDAVYHVRTATEALRIHAAVVQRELDRLYGPRSPHVVHWDRVIWVYVVFVLLLAGGIYVQHRRQSRSRGYFRREYRAGVVFALPWILGFVLLTGGPIVFSLVMAFCDYDVFSPPRWVGLANFRTIFTDDPVFYKSLWNTVYMIIGVPLGMVAGLAIALLLSHNVRGMATYRTFFYLPAIMPAVAASMLWWWLLNPSHGAVNQMLSWVGIPGPAWLQDARWSKPSIILMGLWGAGGGMIIWLAGLRGIPEHLYEAAKIDGAGAWQRFWAITIPMLSPYIFFSLIMGTIGTFQVFAQAYIMTQGGPVDSTLFYVYYLFNHAFRYMRMGYASALAWILFVIILALTAIQLRVAPRWVHYTSE